MITLNNTQRAAMLMPDIGWMDGWTTVLNVYFTSTI